MVELLVVVAVLMVLAALVLAALPGARGGECGVPAAETCDRFPRTSPVWRRQPGSAAGGRHPGRTAIYLPLVHTNVARALASYAGSSNVLDCPNVRPMLLASNEWRWPYERDSLQIGYLYLEVAVPIAGNRPGTGDDPCLPTRPDGGSAGHGCRGPDVCSPVCQPTCRRPRARGLRGSYVPMSLTDSTGYVAEVGAIAGAPMQRGWMVLWSGGKAPVALVPRCLRGPTDNTVCMAAWSVFGVREPSDNASGFQAGGAHLKQGANPKAPADPVVLANDLRWFSDRGIGHCHAAIPGPFGWDRQGKRVCRAIHDPAPGVTFRGSHGLPFGGALEEFLALGRRHLHELAETSDSPVPLVGGRLVKLLQRSFHLHPFHGRDHFQDLLLLSRDGVQKSAEIPRSWDRSRRSVPPANELRLNFGATFLRHRLEGIGQGLRDRQPAASQTEATSFRCPTEIPAGGRREVLPHARRRSSSSGRTSTGAAPSRRRVLRVPNAGEGQVKLEFGDPEAEFPLVRRQHFKLAKFRLDQASRCRVQLVSIASRPAGTPRAVLEQIGRCLARRGNQRRRVRDPGAIRWTDGFLSGTSAPVSRPAAGARTSPAFMGSWRTDWSRARPAVRHRRGGRWCRSCTASKPVTNPPGIPATRDTAARFPQELRS